MALGQIITLPPQPQGSWSKHGLIQGFKLPGRLHERITLLEKAGGRVAQRLALRRRRQQIEHCLRQGVRLPGGN